MKRYGRLWERISSRENILAAVDAVAAAIRTNKCNGRPRSERVERRHQRTVDFLRQNRERIADRICADFCKQTDNSCKQAGLLHPLNEFEVYEPKRRVIQCPCTYDKIVHHALMQVVKPLFVEKFTADSFGSIEGKGRLAALRRLQKFCKQNAYFLQTDVRKFYESVDHDLMKEQVRRVIKCKPTLRLIDEIIDNCPKGLAIGVYPSQYLANLKLTPSDHAVREQRHTPHVRYMDDRWDFFATKEAAHEALRWYRERAKEERLEIKASWRIAPCASGIHALGYVVYPDHTLIGKRTKQRFQRKMRAAFKRAAGVGDEKRRLAVIRKAAASYWGMMKVADCWHLWESVMGGYADIFTNKMKYSETYNKGWFGVPEERRARMRELLASGRELAITAINRVQIKGKDKAVIIFRFPEDTEDRCFITESEVVIDRVSKFFEEYPEEVLECTLVRQFNERTKREYITIK